MYMYPTKLQTHFPLISSWEITIIKCTVVALLVPLFFLTKKLLYTRQAKCVCVFSIHIHSIIYPSIHHHHHRNQFTYNFLLVCVTDGQLFSEKMRWWCDVVFLIVTFLCIEDLEARSFYRVKWVFTTFPLTLSWWRRWLSSSFSK